MLLSCAASGSVACVWPSAHCRRAKMTAPASAASTTSITPGSNTTRRDVAQLAARLFSVTMATAANVTAPTASQAARPAGFGSQKLYSGTPGFSGTRAPAGSTLAAYPATTAMPSRSTPPITTAAANGPPLSPSCVGG